MFSNRLLSGMLMLLLAGPAGAGEQIWQEVPSVQPQSVNSSSDLTRGKPAGQSLDRSARRYKVDNSALRASLQRVTEVIGPGSLEVIRLPMPDGSLADFQIYESPVMENELARKYPQIRTFQVYGIDDPTASGRLDITPSGFHALLHTSQGRLFIDPDFTPQQPDHYLAQSRNTESSPGYSCRIDELDIPARAATGNATAARVAARIPSKFLQYRIAVAATEEYVDLVSAAVSDDQRRDDAQAEIVTAINRVNEIYQRDLGILLKLVDNNDVLIELNGEAGFNNAIPSDLLDQNQIWVDSQLGNSQYDIGHVFGTGGGGLAWLASVCDDSNKARGVSGIANPLGDPFYIDFVAHEIGHQFNARHSFNGTSGQCSEGRNPATAYEPGSGSTIMAYAGICGVEDLQSNNDATFHAGSISEINRFTGSGGSCYALIDASPANPNEPVVSALTNKIIPADTAFVLDAAASDADLDELTYQWEQMDVGCPTDAVSFGSDTGDNALFRSYLPQPDSERYFPALGTRLQGLYDDAEVVPCQDRDINLRVTVRDQKSGQGTANIRVSTINTGSSFRITRVTPGGTISSPDPITVEWDVAGTDQPPVNCSNVDIELMTFARTPTTTPPATYVTNYYSYSIHPLFMGTTNDGSEIGSIPLVNQVLSHPRARIRVKCSDNIFYDISDTDFAINGTGTPTDVYDDDDKLTFFNNNGTTGLSAPACPAAIACALPGESSGGGGGGALDYRWLLLLGGLLVLARLRRGSALR